MMTWQERYKKRTIHTPLLLGKGVFFVFKNFLKVLDKHNFTVYN